MLRPSVSSGRPTTVNTSRRYTKFSALPGRSGVTADLVRSARPADMRLRDPGTHRVKDLADAEQVFQLLHAELPTDLLSRRVRSSPRSERHLPQRPVRNH
jgi:class 3 adenylate cyclase